MALGYGKKRLHRFFLDFNKLHKDMREYYQMDSAEENGWLARLKLEEYGINVEEWEKEVEELERKNH